MPSGTGLDKFSLEFPNRFFDVGIAEQHAVTFCAGMSLEGYKPFCAIYSTFLQRAYDQIVHDVAIQNLPVKFAIDRAGFVGADGATHQGSFDLSYLSCLPNFVIMAPSNEQELINMVKTSVNYNDGPIAIRYPRGEIEGIEKLHTAKILKIGKGKIVLDGFCKDKKADLAFLSIGTRLSDTIKVAKNLKNKGYSVSVADARFAKPFDKQMLIQIAKNHKKLIIIEEASSGGFSSAVISYLANADFINTSFKVRSLTMPDKFLEHKSQEAQIIEAGLDYENILKSALSILEDDKIANIS
jgi:1-deoxy-D-xylulose-5-phosphate synthase